ncbi:hypothetical protein C8F04DRAFT_109771 [Mycena alexandri]|uniref:Uncharacterized protein n=1 Tax=Mycena alexandri TaxID=1745969 RepID=A0AAD6SEX1_9AGAR|nr:hypothetical protein C8F04DRAFT_109771 [Mycena alexandri]
MPFTTFKRSSREPPPPIPRDFTRIPSFASPIFSSSQARKRVKLPPNFDAAKSLYTALGTHRTLLCTWFQAEFDIYRGNHEIARSRFTECLTQGRNIHQQDIVDLCLGSLADPRHNLDSPANTFCWAVVYFCSVRKSKSLVASLQAIRYLAQIFVALGDEDTALSFFRVALEGATEVDIHPLRARCMTGIGEILMRRGNSMEAKQLWAAAHPLFIRSSQVDEARAVAARLEQSISEVTPTPDPTADQPVATQQDQLTMLLAPDESPRGCQF